VTSIETRVTEHSVTCKGDSIHVLDYPGEEPAVVLMHGFPDDHRVYDKLLPLLAPRRAVTFDWLGYGRSGRPDAGGLSSEDHGSELTTVLDALGIASSVLVGHDASGPWPSRNKWHTWCCSTPSSATSLPCSYPR
jgi:haloalkane dehalogenase